MPEVNFTAKTKLCHTHSRARQGSVRLRRCALYRPSSPLEIIQIDLRPPKSESKRDLQSIGLQYLDTIALLLSKDDHEVCS